MHSIANCEAFCKLSSDAVLNSMQYKQDCRSFDTDVFESLLLLQLCVLENLIQYLNPIWLFISNWFFKQHDRVW